MYPQIVLILLLIILALRHVPQLYADFRNARRKPLLKNRAPVNEVYLAIFWMCLIGRAGYRIFANSHERNFLWVAGLLIFLSGAIIGALAFWALGSSYSAQLLIFPESHLVRKGIYSVVRHPMRLGLALETFGAVLLSGEWKFFLLWLVYASVLAQRTKQEDAMLRAFYGIDAEQYLRNVPSWNIFAGILRRSKTFGVITAHR